jgi:cysteinyl-tRNA synthetase
MVSMLAHFAHTESNPVSFAYILQADSFAKTKNAAIAQLKDSGRDWIVLDAAFAGDTPWEQTDLDTIRRGKAGRKVVAYLSIGEAEDYRPYWKSEWGSNGKRTASAPAWLGIENPDWKGNYQVKYWNGDWQKLVLAAVDDAMTRGFDGVYLDIVDGFETYEQGAGGYLDKRINPESKQTYRRDMVDWVKAIAVRARVNNPAALVIPQNGSQLVADKDFVEVISAQGIEDLFTNGKKLQPASHTDEILGHLKTLALANKPVLLIEYPKTPERQALSKKLAKENGLVWLVTDRQLKTLGQSGK